MARLMESNAVHVMSGLRPAPRNVSRDLRDAHRPRELDAGRTRYPSRYLVAEDEEYLAYLPEARAER